MGALVLKSPLVWKKMGNWLAIKDHRFILDSRENLSCCVFLRDEYATESDLIIFGRVKIMISMASNLMNKKLILVFKLNIFCISFTFQIRGQK